MYAATYLLLIIIYLSFISLGLPDSLLGSAWPLIYKDMGVPLHYAGAVAMIGSGGTVISSIMSARVIRRFGTGLVTAVSVVMTAGALFGFSCSHYFISLCLLAIPLGLGAGAVDAALNNYVALHYKAKHMNWLHCFWGVGASIGPMILSSYLSADKSWALGYRKIAFIQTALAVILFAALPLWGKHIRAAESETRPDNHHAPVPFKKLLSIPGLTYTLAIFFCYCSVEAITGLWGGTYMVTVRQIAPDAAARRIALFYGGITAGRFICGFLTTLLNNRRMIWLGCIVTACGITALFIPSNIALVPGFFLIGFGFAPVYPSLIHETPRSFGSAVSQQVIGLQMACAYIGTTLMPPFFGRIAGKISWTIFPAAVILFVAVEILLLTAAFKQIDQKRAGEQDRTQTNTPAEGRSDQERRLPDAE